MCMMRGWGGAASAMFLLGTLAAVSGLVNEYPLYGGQAMRYTLAAAILFTVARIRGLGLVRLTRRETVLLLALAATGLVLFNFFVINGTRHASPAMVGTVVGAVPILLALAGPLMNRTRPSLQVVVAAVIVVAGTTLTTGFGAASPAGILYAVGALGCEACFSLLALPLLPRLGPIRVSAYTASAAVPMLLVGGVLSDGSDMVRMPTLAEAAGLLYLAAVVSAGAFLLWYGALPRLGAARAGLFAGMVPIGAIVTTVILGFGLPTVTELAGAAVVVAGLLIGLRQTPHRQSRVDGLRKTRPEGVLG